MGNLFAELPNLRYVLRYRDLVADTMGEHTKIITQYGACWWGWWKRPSEPGRTEVWDALREVIQSKGAAVVGLFDSGSGNLRLARAVGVIEPRADGSEGWLQVPVPQEEIELVPAYYRTSPFSRAWLKFDEIRSEPVDFFMRFTYAEAPPLPNLPRAFLDRFRGKLVLDADEMRGMDTTIWTVQQSVNGSGRKDRIIIGAQSAIEPISRTPIRLHADTILHITDPHFAKGANRREHVWRLESEPADGRLTLADAIVKAVSGNKIGLIVITGDLTFTGTPEEFREAAASITKLLGCFDLWHDHLVIVPGNHDIQWTTSEVYDPATEVKVVPEAAKANYRTFYQELFRHSPNVHLSMGRIYLLPHGGIVEVCALNSSSLETGRQFLAGMGRVQEGALSEAGSDLGWAVKQSHAFRLLALHHHLVTADNVEDPAEFYKGFGMAIDSPRIQRMAVERGVHLVLHGHKHRAFFTRHTVYALPEHKESSWLGQELSIVGGGSAGSPSSEGSRSYFNLLRVAGAGIELSMFRTTTKAGAFGPMDSIHGSFAIDEGRLVLGTWKSGQLPNEK